MENSLFDAALAQNIANPSRCLADARFYTVLNGTDEMLGLIDQAVGEMVSLFIELNAEGLLPQVASGVGGEEMQLVLEARRAEDARIARMYELTKLRLMVSADEEKLTVQ